jgi:hypothetical protein
MDVSKNGAKIMAAIPSEMPDKFQLAFSQGGGKRQNCVVIWRRARAVGVQFLER